MMTPEAISIRSRWLGWYLDNLKEQGELRRKTWWKIHGGNRSAARSRAKDKMRHKP